MISTRALTEIALTTICVFFVAFEIAVAIRGALMGDSVYSKLLIFFAIVALAGGLLGVHYVNHSPGMERYKQALKNQGPAPK